MNLHRLKKKFDRSRYSEIVVHVLFWLGYFSLNSIRWGHYFGDYGYSFRSNLVEFPIHIILVYFNLFYLIPKLVPKRTLTYMVTILLAILFMSLLRIFINYQFVTTEIWRESVIEQSDLVNLNYIIAVFIGELYVVGFTMAIKLTIDWVKSERKSRELEQRNLHTELSFLRSQMQPHFFFNTLNNLYSLTLDKSDQAPETVLKLSDLMSYVVYKGKNNKVNISDEIRHLNNYLDLERLRYDERLKVNFDIDGQIDGKEIPPLLLVTFLENAFKHGSSNTLGDIEIDIRLTVNATTLTYEVTNDYKAVPVKKRASTSGIGIENTRRRLDLLFKKDYLLSIADQNSKFKIMLQIPLQ